MTKYKTAVTDYEGLETCLNSHAAQGWRLATLNADTWRKSLPTGDQDGMPFASLASDGVPSIEYSASYYLVVFQRDDYGDVLELANAAEEQPSHGGEYSRFEE